jgi:pimeloyl-ACP methyl ester carboxylesterase
MEAASLGDQVEQRFGAKPVAIGASLGGLAALLALGQATCFSALVLVDIVPRTEAGGVAHVENFMRARAREGFASIDEAAESIAAYLPHRTKPRSTEGLRKNLRQRADGRWYCTGTRAGMARAAHRRRRGADFRLEQISRNGSRYFLYAVCLTSSR